MTLQAGFLIFPRIQLLDLAGPFDVLTGLPDVAAHLVGKTPDTVVSTSGLRLAPDYTFASCPPLDILCVPGGNGITDLLNDQDTLDFVRRQAEHASYLTSVCTGTLLLGTAGLLRGRRATTHWAFHELLETLGATPEKARIVRDGNLITGGGVTAGIDFALSLAAELAGATEAQAIQLELEYAPAPPFDAGRPDTAPREIVDLVRQRSAQSLQARTDAIARWKTQRTVGDHE
jgi:cyclohexyl-isocyanide hydratase